MLQEHKLRTINALTGVRFLAAMLVFLFHFGASFSERIGLPHMVSTFLHNGKIGVSMFFVLSGFILTYTYTKSFSVKFAFMDFFVARFARIYPVYLLALIMILPVLPKLLDAWSVLCVLIMVQSWTSPFSSFGGTWVMQAWTLSVELFFYLCFPVLLIWMRHIKLRMILVGIFFLSLIIVALGTPWIDPGVKFIPLLPKEITPFLPILRLPEFIFGMLICKLIFISPQLGDKISEFRLTLVTLLLMIILLSFTESVELKSVASILFGLFIIQLSYGKNLMVNILSSNQMVLLGGASYALYITQGPIRQWFYWTVDKGIISEKIASILNPMVTISLSIIIFIYWEQPARKVLRNFYNWISTKKF
jgi:peptidoglycan/LPS O-acetylase OafA/YrhL